MWLLLACHPHDEPARRPAPRPAPAPAPTPTLPRALDAGVRPSRYVPSAFVVEWDGPAGDAELWVGPPGGDLARHAAAEVSDGAGRLPLALLPAGEVEWQVRLRDRAGDRWESARGVVTVPAAPLADGVVVRADPRSEVAQGWLVANTYTSAGRPDEGLAVVFDGQGRIVWWLPPEPGGQRALRARPSRDGRSILVLQDHARSDDFADLVSLDGETRVRTPTPDVSHDVVEAPDGSLAWLAYDHAPAGAMPEYPGDAVAADRVMRAPVGGAAEQVWSFLEDYPATPFRPCGHATPDTFVPGYVEWTHGNSLLLDPGGDGWWLVARYLDAVVHVPAAGGASWQLGGRDATLVPTSTAPFLHGHASHTWTEPDGPHLLMFDNGTHGPAPVVSRVVELAVDPVAGTWREVWSLPDPLGRETGFLGDARRLPGGDTLVVWTPYADVAEYRPDGEVVWRLRAPRSLGRATFTDALLP